MIKGIIFALLLASGGRGWEVNIISHQFFVIENHTREPITCYIYYLGGNYAKVYVAAGDVSRPLTRKNIDTVECY